MKQKFMVLLTGMLMMHSSAVFSQLVTNTTTLETFSTIQAAIDDANTLNGHTLSIAAGAYYENVLVNKEVSIIGPKAGVDGNDASRGTGEAVLYPPAIWYGDGTYNGGYLIRVTADNVTIEGMTLNGDNPALAGNFSTNHGEFDIDFGILSYWSPWYEYPYTNTGPEGYDPSGDLAGDNLKIKNNVFKNFKFVGIYLQSDYYNPTPKNGEVLHNRIDNVSVCALFLMQNYYANIDYNTINNSQIGIQFYFYWLGRPNSTTGTIRHNNINSATIITNWGDTYTAVSGINSVLVYNNIPQSWEISDNSIVNSSTLSVGSKGILSYINWTPTALNFANNNITGYEYGYDLRSSGDGGEGLTPAPTQALTISGGTVSNCKYGVWATNLSAYYGTAQSAMYNINQVTFNNNTEAGIFVDDESPLNANLSTVAAHANNCRFYGNPVGIKLSGTYAYGSAHNNDLSSANCFAINNLSPNVFDATCNWYGHWTGPKQLLTNNTGQGSKVSDRVTYDPWLVYGTDDAPSIAGFQPVPGSCVTLRCGNNNKKYLLCHNGMTKCFGYDDALIHIAHGDAFGACTPSSITASGTIVPEEQNALQFKITTAPNPFINSTTLKYELPFDSKVSIKVYDMMGKEVASLVNGEKKAGVYTVSFDASRLSKGIYYYRLKAFAKEKEFTQSGKLLKQ
jgi:hypothetical protein